MRSLFKSATIAVFICATVITANAQKIAHINLDSLISMMPNQKKRSKKHKLIFRNWKIK